MYDQITKTEILDRPRMREIFHVVFQVTDDMMLDLLFRAFDQDMDGEVS